MKDKELSHFQVLQLAIQIQPNMFLHHANCSKSVVRPEEYDSPANEITGVLSDIYHEIETALALIEQRFTD